ncbi:low temperature requirement protein A [Halomarina pelagica]|uniref:low temperature requirement protein A n=1 Tax=Halomarina pelagica TaxID=2961599 RepID=UPI0020C1ED3F|nr:low temperature requirement protein A [Halomarina sp. BND7]
MFRSALASLASPALHDAESDPERHATWLELFFDLVFVVAVAELGHLLAENLTPGGIVEFAALFVPVWWVWITHSYYGDVFDDGDAVYPLATLATMFGVVVWSVTFHGALHGGSVGYVLVYLALRALSVGLYLFAASTTPEARTLARRFAAGYSLGLALWVASLAVPEPLRFGLWAIGLAVEALSSPVVYVTLPDVPAQVSHMDERFGLFTIIVLGEAIVAVAAGTAEVEWALAPALAATCGFVVAVCLWWLYFEYSDATVIDRALVSDARGLTRSFVYGYGHLALFASIVATGVGIGAVIDAAAASAALSTSARIVLCGGLGVFLLGLIVVQWAAVQPVAGATAAVRLGAAAAFLLVGVVGVGLPPSILLAGLTALVLCVLGSELVRARRGVAGVEAEI